MHRIVSEPTKNTLFRRFGLLFVSLEQILGNFMLLLVSFEQILGNFMLLFVSLVQILGNFMLSLASMKQNNREFHVKAHFLFSPYLQ
ncbi:hypothetical protein CON84_04780 [Bacillus sp. AFS094228]|nr:hypothetical protein CON84_04780 [Bacillus sp. AFS094228]